jgi:4-hydroxyphenylpyruvate dioxygenase
MADLFENPLGLDGFEFIEFRARKGRAGTRFRRDGLHPRRRHRSKDVQLWRQGGINLIANYEPQPGRLVRRRTRPFGLRHGLARARCGQGLCRALERGAEPVEVRPARWNCACRPFRGIGGSIIYLIDRYGDDLSIYDIDFVYWRAWTAIRPARA